MFNACKLAHNLTNGAKKMARQKKKPFNVYLTDELMTFIRAQAEKEDQAMTDYITGLIKADKRKQERKK